MRIIRNAEIYSTETLLVGAHDRYDSCELWMDCDPPFLFEDSQSEHARLYACHIYLRHPVDIGRYVWNGDINEYWFEDWPTSASRPSSR